MGTRAPASISTSLTAPYICVKTEKSCAGSADCGCPSVKTAETVLALMRSSVKEATASAYAQDLISCSQGIKSQLAQWAHRTCINSLPTAFTHHASDRCHCSVGIRHTVGNQACSKSWWNQCGLCQDTAKPLVRRWLQTALVAAACGLYCQRILIALLETVLRQFCTGIGFCLPLNLTAESSLRPATQAVQKAQSSLQHGFGQQIAGRSFGMKTRLREAAARKPMLIRDAGFWGFPARERVRPRPRPVL